MTLPKRLLVPTDFSPASKQALPHVRDLAKTFGSEVILLHVMDLPVYPVSFGIGPVIVPPIEDEARARVQASLEQLRQEMLAGVNARTILREGRPYLEIVSAAEAEGADWIVIATHGYTGLKHVVLGSTAERVVRLAKCAVLTVHAH